MAATAFEIKSRFKTGVLACVFMGLSGLKRACGLTTTSPCNKGKPLHPSLLTCKQHLIIYFLSSSRGMRPRGHTHTADSRVARSRRTSHPATPPTTTRSCVCVWGGGGGRHLDTYGRVEGKGALALENPVSCPGHPDGGHVRDQQLSEVCSHLRIPASRTTVPRSHRSSAVRGEDAIFKALRLYIPAASGM